MADPDLLARIAALERENAELRATVDRGRDEARFLESVVENIPDMIFVKDAAELRFVRFNAAGEHLLGYRRADLIGKSDRDFFPPDEAEHFIAKDREVLARRTVLDIPEEPIHTGRGARWLHTKKIPILDDDGRPLYLLGISEDITDRKRAEEALRERKAELTRAIAELTMADRRLRVLLQHFPGVMWTADAGLRFMSTAGAHVERLGLVCDKVRGEAIGDHLPPAGPGVDAEALHRAALDGAPGTYELHHGGNTYEVRVERLGDGPEDGVIAVALDVTERRRVESERLRARLERAQKLELLGLLAGGIAHDFNNLLTVILGNASLALLRLPPGDPSRVPIERVEQTAQNAADLTRQLLAYSGKGRFVVEAHDLSRLIEDTGALLRVTIPKAIELKLDLARDLPPCEVDATQVRQVLINLITNAADAIGEGRGTITLATGTVIADREYLSRAWLDEELPEGLYAWMEVSDDGQGMDPETQNHMFDPFYTTKSRGHGLGLSATLGIVRGHRGAIRVYSERGRGTTIKVLLPAAGGAVVSPGVPPASLAAPRSMGGILVVDDEAAIRTFATDTLEGAGFRVFTAVDGVDALERFRARGAEIDAVLLDMTMPRMGGEETFRELARLRPGVRVLLSSGYNEQDATNRFAGKGLAGFLQKPYTARQLIERVRALMSR